MNNKKNSIMLADLPFELTGSIIRGPPDSVKNKPFNHFFLVSLLRHNKQFNTGLIRYYNLFNEQSNKRNYLLTGVRFGLLPELKYLVENGADIHVENDEALRYAAKNGHLAIVKYLIEHGADVHSNNDQALRYAS